MFYFNSRAIIERINQGKLQILIQNRVKLHEQKVFTYELPGGRVEKYESLTKTLIREVKEETGLDITYIEGIETRVDTKKINSEFVVECIKPFAAYQTVRGPVDSLGVYFRCKARGKLLKHGDHSFAPQWIDVDEIVRLMDEDPLQFSDVDRAGILFYMKNS